MKKSVHLIIALVMLSLNYVCGQVATANAVAPIGTDNVSFMATCSNSLTVTVRLQIEISTNQNFDGSSYAPSVGLPVSPGGSINQTINQSDLQPGTKYYYRTVIGTGGAPIEGVSKNFTTAEQTQGNNNVTVNLSSSNVTMNSVRINYFYANNSGDTAELQVEYAKDSLFANSDFAPSTGFIDLKPGTGSGNTTLTGLSASAKYFYRGVVITSGGSTNGQYKTFTTDHAPYVTSSKLLTANGLDRSAVINYKLKNTDPDALGWFKYATSADFSDAKTTSTQALEITTGSGKVLSATIFGLTAGTVYYVTMVYMNSTMDTTTNTLTVKTVLSGVENVESLSSKIKLTPNPDPRSIVCEIANPDFKFIVYDVIGNQVKIINIKSTETEFDKKDLAPGVYIYRVNDETKTVKTGKFIVN